MSVFFANKSVFSVTEPHDESKFSSGAFPYSFLHGIFIGMDTYVA